MRRLDETSSKHRELVRKERVFWLRGPLLPFPESCDIDYRKNNEAGLKCCVFGVEIGFIRLQNVMQCHPIKILPTLLKSGIGPAIA